MSLPAFAQEEELDEIFLVTLNKCVGNEFNMKEHEDLKLLVAPEMSLVCSRKAKKISCKILRKDDGKFQAISEKTFKIFADVGDVGEIRSEDDHTSLVLNQRLNKALYSQLEYSSTSVIKQLVCSGTLKDTRAIKKVITPPPVDYNKKIKPPVELTPSRIGD